MTKNELLAKIQQAKNEQFLELDLSNQGITELPPEIGQLTSLQSLDLRSNELNKLPFQIGKLAALKLLGLSFNNLTKLPAEIRQLTSLKWLDLAGNNFTQLPPEIGQLTALQSLYLNHNKLTQLPPEIGQLTALQTLYLSNNNLTQLPKEIGRLTDLKSLNLSSNNLTQLPSEIAQLTALQSLDLNSNNLTQLPSEIGQLTVLQQLYLNENKLHLLPFEIEVLKNLVVLDIRNNLASKYNAFGKLKKQGAGIYIPQNSPNLPEEFLEKGSWEIYRYLTSDKRKPIPLNEAKLILVGDGAVGKTCLVHQLLHDKFETHCKTEGIDRHQWLEMINGHNIRLNVWDFGGQEVLHATHQFFLTKRSVYILVLDARRGEQESRLEYWLKLIQSFGSDSPILIAINKSDEEHRLTLNQRFLKEKYPSIKEFYPVSCVTGQGINEFKQGIKKTVSLLPHIHDLMPASWFELKQSLEEKKDNYISYEDYKNLCIKHDITEPGSQSTLCGFLHDLGIVLNFRDDERFDRLRETNVLNPEWVTNAVYKLLNTSELFLNHGVFTVSDLARILDSSAYPSSKEHRFIIDMMQKFELCFPIPDTSDYLIPELLQNEEPDLNWSKDDSLRFEYHYDILPHSVLSRFIVRLHEYISKKTYWRTGVVLVHENNKALVKADIEDRKIFISVTGNTATRRVLLGIIRKEFKHIHSTIKGLDAKEKVPYKNIVIDYQHLLDLEELEQETFIPEGLKEKVKVKELLTGVDNPEIKPTTTIIEVNEGGVATVDVKNIKINESKVNGNVTAAHEIKESFNERIDDKKESEESERLGFIAKNKGFIFAVLLLFSIIILASGYYLIHEKIITADTIKALVDKPSKKANDEP